MSLNFQRIPNECRSTFELTPGKTLSTLRAERVDDVMVKSQAGRHSTTAPFNNGTMLSHYARTPFFTVRSVTWRNWKTAGVLYDDVNDKLQGSPVRVSFRFTAPYIFMTRVQRDVISLSTWRNDIERHAFLPLIYSLNDPYKQ